MSTAVSDYITEFVAHVTQKVESLPTDYTEPKLIDLTKKMEAFSHQSLEKTTPEATITLLQYEFSKPSTIAAKWKSQFEEQQFEINEKSSNLYIHLIVMGFVPLQMILIAGTLDIGFWFLWLLGSLLGIIFLNITKRPLDVASVQLLKRWLIPVSFGVAAISLLLNQLFAQNIQAGLFFFIFYAIISFVLYANFHYLLKHHTQAQQ